MVVICSSWRTREVSNMKNKLKDYADRPEYSANLHHRILSRHRGIDISISATEPDKSSQIKQRDINLLTALIERLSFVSAVAVRCFGLREIQRMRLSAAALNRSRRLVSSNEIFRKLNAAHSKLVGAVRKFR